MANSVIKQIQQDGTYKCGRIECRRGARGHARETAAAVRTSVERAANARIQAANIQGAIQATQRWTGKLDR